mmetsp:Transcript_5230/g.7069  ORF Transcript_5230/g.7069 Transcript_5230/m.7069 type:complete len:188 (-) Transcript_5230:181-744(-)
MHKFLLFLRVTFSCCIVMSAGAFTTDRRVMREQRVSFCFKAEKSDEMEVGDKNMEIAWRHIKKPLLRIGKSGMTESHGNSLRDLLSQHQAVKVKINTNKLGTLEEVFYQLKEYTENAGSSKGVELLRVRPSDSTIMVGSAGLSELISQGEFPSKKALEIQAYKRQKVAEKKQEAREAREQARLKRGR